MASREVRRLVGLPAGQMRPRNADFGRVTPLEVGIRTTLSPTHTQVPAGPKFGLLASAEAFRRCRPGFSGCRLAFSGCRLAFQCQPAHTFIIMVVNGWSLVRWSVGGRRSGGYM